MLNMFKWISVKIKSLQISYFRISTNASWPFGQDEVLNQHHKSGIDVTRYKLISKFSFKFKLFR